MIIINYYYKRLKDLREDNDLTQTKIAKVLGIRQEYYSKYELGKIEIPVHHLIQIAKFYKVSTDYILGLTNKSEPGYKIKNNVVITNNNGKIKID